MIYSHFHDSKKVRRAKIKTKVSKLKIVFSVLFRSKIVK